MEATCGAKTFWAVNTSGHFAFVKPLGDKAGEHTNINLITTAGNVYTLLVREVSKEANAHADLKLFLEQADEDAVIAMSHPAFVKASQLDEMKKQLDSQAKELAQTKRDAGLSELKKLKHDYMWKDGREAEAMGLHSIYRDDRWMFIEASSQEAPVLHEISDGKDRLINYTLEGNRYVVQKIIDHGYLRVGKKRLEFTRNKETI